MFRRCSLCHTRASRKLSKAPASKTVDGGVLAGFLGVQETNTDADRADEEPDFLLNQLETHRQQRESDEKVQCTEDELLLGRPRVETRAGHVVAKTDRRQRNETEIEADQEVPVVFIAIFDVSCYQQPHVITSTSHVCDCYCVCVCVLCTLII